MYARERVVHPESPGSLDKAFHFDRFATSIRFRSQPHNAVAIHPSTRFIPGLRYCLFELYHSRQLSSLRLKSFVCPVSWFFTWWSICALPLPFYRSSARPLCSQYRSTGLSFTLLELLLPKKNSRSFYRGSDTSRSVTFCLKQGHLVKVMAFHHTHNGH